MSVSETTTTTTTDPKPGSQLPTTTEAVKPSTSEFKPIQSQEQFDQMIADRIKRAAEKAKEDAKAELNAELDQKRKADEAERQRKADIEAGKFEEVKVSLETERNDFKSRAETAETKLQSALTLLASSVNERWKDVPEEVAELYEGDADDPLAKTAFIDKNAKLIARIKGTQDAAEQKFAAASRTRTPTPDRSGTTADDERAKREQARSVSGI
jgi:beta-glucosidase-like glycosyl hydrolase